MQGGRLDLGCALRAGMERGKGKEDNAVGEKYGMRRSGMTWQNKAGHGKATQNIKDKTNKHKYQQHRFSM